MANQRIADWLYDLVAQDAHFQCGYCRCPQQVLPYRLEIEHLLPTSLGGQDDRENLWLSCHRCNKLRSNLMHGVMEWWSDGVMEWWSDGVVE